MREHNRKITKESIVKRIMEGEAFRQIALEINMYDTDFRIDLIVTAMSACKQLGKEQANAN